MNVLQDIEFILVTAYRDDKTIDDVIISNALRGIIYNKTYEDFRTLYVIDQLGEMRKVREDISDKVWLDSLKAVLQSVHNHSSLREGSRGYLNFVSGFIV